MMPPDVYPYSIYCDVCRRTFDINAENREAAEAKFKAFHVHRPTGKA